MSLVKFSEYLGETISINDDEVIVEWSEEGWNSLTVSERAEIDAEAGLGWAMWHVGPLTIQGIENPEDEEGTDTFIVYENEAISEYIDSFAELDEELDEDAWLTEYKARNKKKQKKTMKVKRLSKFKNRALKLKKKIQRKKGSVKVKIKKLRKKWMRVNKAKIRNAQKVFGTKR
jgi:hypothetical protein